jgi:hypothetical protein
VFQQILVGGEVCGGLMVDMLYGAKSVFLIAAHGDRAVGARHLENVEWVVKKLRFCWVGHGTGLICRSSGSVKLWYPQNCGIFEVSKKEVQPSFFLKLRNKENDASLWPPSCWLYKRVGGGHGETDM